MDNNLIFGIRPVAEAVEAGRQIEKLYIRKGAAVSYTHLTLPTN